MSRHPVEFITYDNALYAVKELPVGIAEKEYNLLISMENSNLPVVHAEGYAVTRTEQGDRSILITRYLENSLPYSSLFTVPNLKLYQDHLLDALAGLLVQLHISGIFWGDCSLYNTLFRRDAGKLQAYLVDAETAIIHENLSVNLRKHDLEIMEENVIGGLTDLVAAGILNTDYPTEETGASIHDRYGRLWLEITREIFITPVEKFRIQERINTLNNMGFSVSEVGLQSTVKGDQLKLSVAVTDRNFHRRLIHTTLGINGEEMQARQMINEIKEIKAWLSSERGRSIPLNVAAFHWQNQYYQPVIDQLSEIRQEGITDPELYCQFLTHKWLLSEKAQIDVGREAAILDFKIHTD